MQACLPGDDCSTPIPLTSNWFTLNLSQLNCPDPPTPVPPRTINIEDFLPDVLAETGAWFGGDVCPNAIVQNECESGDFLCEIGSSATLPMLTLSGNETVELCKEGCDYTLYRCEDECQESLGWPYWRCHERCFQPYTRCLLRCEAEYSEEYDFQQTVPVLPEWFETGDPIPVFPPFFSTGEQYYGVPTW